MRLWDAWVLAAGRYVGVTVQARNRHGAMQAVWVLVPGAEILELHQL